MRAALGAGRGRLLQQVAVEATVLAVAGGVAALVAAHWVSQALRGFVLPGGVAIGSLRDGLDARSLLFAGCATAVASLVIVGVSAVGATSRRLALSLRTGAATSPRLAATRVLVSVQVAVCVVLVFGAVLFARSLSNALATDVGFDTRGLASATVGTPESVMQVDGLTPLDTLVERARTLPGVSAVTAGPLPLVRGSDTSHARVYVDGVPRDLEVPVEVVYAAPEYFTVLGQPLRRGRDFDRRDASNGRPVAIVNQAAARQFWGNQDPIERHIGIPSFFVFKDGRMEARLDIAVVGVVPDVKVRHLRETGLPVIYLPRLQHQEYLAGYSAGRGSSFLILRTTGNLADVHRSLAAMAATVGLSILGVTTLEDGINRIVMPQRLGRALLMMLGAAALALTLVGIYGLLAFLVSRNRREIGVRIALGAAMPQVAGTVLRRAVWPIAAGLATGSVAAAAGGRFADRFMYGIAGSDPSTVALALAITTGVATMAAFVPTRRALRVNPVESLRAE